MSDDVIERNDDDQSTELAALRQLGAELGVEDTEWETPPTNLWSRIAAEVGVDPESDPVHTQSAVRERGPGEVGDVVEMQPRRHRMAWALGAAAALLVVVIVGVALLVDRSDSSEVVASVPLDTLAGEGSGEAELVLVDGNYRLKVDTTDLDPEDGFLELWLIDPDVTQLVSLGPLRDDGTYDLPAGLDPRDFPVVDVSVEPFNGDPTHSGNSLLRGQLTL